MFLLLPVGVEGNEVRLPIVSLGIAVLCAFGFLVTWIIPGPYEDVGRDEIIELYLEQKGKPYLEMPEKLSKRFLNPYVVAQQQLARADWLSKHKLSAAQEEEQAEFTQRCLGVVALMEKQPMYRWSMVPARGLKQLGFLTHMFLHFGWLHLLGNLLFFYMTAPFLEDVWGRGRFAGFYVVAGILAAVAQYWMDRSSTIPMAGASGAIAGCMGAFAVRFPFRRVRMGYLIFLAFRVFRGTFPMQAWLCGVLWFGSELLSLALGDTEGVAVMAHVGGFAFGAGVAFFNKAMGWEKEELGAADISVQAPTASVLDEVAAARAAFDQRNYSEARGLLDKAVREHPGDLDAELELVKLDLAEGQKQAAVFRLEKTLSASLKRGATAIAVPRFFDLWRQLDVEMLSPLFCWQMARACEQQEDGTKDLAEPLFARAGAEPGVLGPRALLRAAELRQAVGTELWVARPYLEALEKHLSATPDQKAKAAELLATLPQRPDHTFLAKDELAPPPPPKVLACVLKSVSEQGCILDSPNGHTNQLKWAEVVGVAAGLVPNAQRKGVLLVDLVVKWGDSENAAVVLRLDSESSQVHAFEQFRANGAAETWSRFLTFVFDATQARGLPDTESLKRGQFAKYASAEVRDQELYAAV